MWIKDYVRQHPSVIVRGYVPFSKIVDSFKFRYNAIDMSLSETPSMWMHRFNAINLPANEKLHLTENQLDFKAIKIPITNETKHYTDKDYVPVVKGDCGIDDFIYLVYEEKVGYKYSNSNKLFLEVSISRGIPVEDIENNTEEYLDYLVRIQRYLEHTHPEICELFPEE